MPTVKVTPKAHSKLVEAAAEDKAAFFRISIGRG